MIFSHGVITPRRIAKYDLCVPDLMISLRDILSLMLAAFSEDLLADPAPGRSRSGHNEPTSPEGAGGGLSTSRQSHRSFGRLSDGLHAPTAN
jgi:hypothetical protein